MWYNKGILDLITALAHLSLVSTLSAERIRENWGKSGCCLGCGNRG